MWVVVVFSLWMNQSLAQITYGIEIPLSYTKTYTLVPLALHTIEGTGGDGYDIGLGFFINVNETFEIKGGFHSWNKVFNPTHKGEYTINEETTKGKIEENGNLSYTGIYCKATYEKEIFFIGGGFDYSFSHSYKSDISFYDANNNLLAEVNGSNKSFLTDKFNSQFDLLFTVGFKIGINESIKICPSLDAAIPLVEFFNTGVSVYDPYHEKVEDVVFNAFLLKLGLRTEFSL